jgi:hypothetical protein
MSNKVFRLHKNNPVVFLIYSLSKAYFSPLPFCLSTYTVLFSLTFFCFTFIILSFSVFIFLHFFLLLCDVLTSTTERPGVLT